MFWGDDCDPQIAQISQIDGGHPGNLSHLRIEELGTGIWGEGRDLLLLPFAFCLLTCSLCLDGRARLEVADAYCPACAFWNLPYSAMSWAKSSSASFL